MTFSLQQIGVIHSPWKEKFAVPRQPGLIDDGGGELHLLAPYNRPEAVRGLEGFSHLWIIFMFHQTMQQGWRPAVRPPRLGGNQRIGVFATRSPFRPNAIGMSLVTLENIRCEKNAVVLTLGSLDIVDGTPVIDIKPYLPWAEAIPDARAGFAQDKPDAMMPVFFTAQAQQQLQHYRPHYPHLERFIRQLLAQDPRPAYHRQKNEQRSYAVRLLAFTIRWRVSEQGNEVFTIEPC